MPSADAGDYEFAEHLLKAQGDVPGFPAGDLVERLANRLLNGTGEPVRWEGRLIQALLLRSQAGRGSPEKKVELLGQAEAVYTEFLQKNAKHRLSTQARETLNDVRTDFIRALLAGEDDGSPERTAACRRAVAMVEGMLPERKAASEAAWAALEAITLPDDPTREIPQTVLHRLGMAIEKAVIADQTYLNTWLLLVEACPRGERRSKEIEALTAFCQKRIDHERLMDCDLACALYLYLKGRAFAFQPDEVKATEAWRTALSLLPETVMEREVANTVYPLQAGLLLDYVKMKMNGCEQAPERCEEVVRVVEAVGALIMILGGLYAVLLYARRGMDSDSDRYQVLRRNLGRAILLGLEVLIIADIVRTIIVEPTLESEGDVPTRALKTRLKSS